MVASEPTDMNDRHRSFTFVVSACDSGVCLSRDTSEESPFHPSVSWAENDRISLFLKGDVFEDDGTDLTIGGSAPIAAEDLARRIAKHGTEVLRSIDGRFALVWLEKCTGKIVAACDSCASIPLYYATTKARMVISDNIVAAAKANVPTVDRESLWVFLTSAYLIGNRTLLEDVRRVMGGEFLSTDGVEYKTSVYWEPLGSYAGFSTAPEFLGHLDHELQRIASQRGRLILLLSGGVDSRLIALRLRSLDIPFEAISYGELRAGSTDLGIAREICVQLGVPLIEWPYDHADFMSRVRRMIVFSGGVNDGYTSCPDNDVFLSKFSGATILRGDENLGWGTTSVSVAHAVRSLGLFGVGIPHLVEFIAT